MYRLLNPYVWIGALTLFGAFKLYAGWIWLVDWVELVPYLWHNFWK